MTDFHKPNIPNATPRTRPAQPRRPFPLLPFHSRNVRVFHYAFAPFAARVEFYQRRLCDGTDDRRSAYSFLYLHEAQMTQRVNSRASRHPNTAHIRASAALRDSRACGGWAGADWIVAHCFRRVDIQAQKFCRTRPGVLLAMQDSTCIGDSMFKARVAFISVQVDFLSTRLRKRRGLEPLSSARPRQHIDTAKRTIVVASAIYLTISSLRNPVRLQPALLSHLDAATHVFPLFTLRR